LNLPKEVYSLPVRKRVAEQARGVSLQQTVDAVDRSTGAHVPKRQAEQLVVRSAQVFDVNYFGRPTTIILADRRQVDGPVRRPRTGPGLQVHADEERSHLCSRFVGAE
jgi:hypothetical protein